MFWLIVILLIVAVIAWFNYNIATKGKAQLKSIEACIAQIERNPNLQAPFKKFIETWNSSTWVQSEDLFNGGYYDRILNICESNSSSVKTLELLLEAVKKLNLAFAINVTGKSYRTKTFKILADNISKQFYNKIVREQIITTINAISGLTQKETQELYNISLKILEANPSSQEAKVMVLEFGRMHYSILRPDKKPTIYDEQAIQNDIIVRPK